MERGAAVPGTHPRAAEAAWGIPDAVTVQAGIFTGLKKIDEMYGLVRAAPVKSSNLVSGSGRPGDPDKAWFGGFGQLGVSVFDLQKQKAKSIDFIPPHAKH